MFTQFCPEGKGKQRKCLKCCTQSRQFHSPTPKQISFNDYLKKKAADKNQQTHFSNNRKHLNTLQWEQETGRSPERSKLWWWWWCCCHRKSCWPHHISFQSEVGREQGSKGDWVVSMGAQNMLLRSNATTHFHAVTLFKLSSGDPKHPIHALYDL